MRPSTSGPLALSVAPQFCQYANGPCDQQLPDELLSRAFWIFPGNPPEVSATIDAAVEHRRSTHGEEWRSWRHLDIEGQLIFCEICKGLRSTEVVIADVTTLNMNVMFEIGYAIGLGLPVIPIRDTSYSRDDEFFTEIGIFDTLGYVAFNNSEQLRERLLKKLPKAAPLAEVPHERSVRYPLFVVKPPVPIEGHNLLESALKKSALKYRTYDPVETSRLTLTDARRSAASAFGVVVHMMGPNRRGHEVHNARAALVAGLAMANERATLILQESEVTHPIDYRDVARSYRRPSEVEKIVAPFLRQVVSLMQARDDRPPVAADPNTLLDLDLGDFAAENEISDLPAFFVPTGQWRQAKAGRARLIVGRKGSGKTAIFYRIRDSLPSGHSTICLDLKPEGDQFARLKETVLAKVSAGMAEHTLTALWTKIILAELARKILNEYRHAQHDSERLRLYEEVSRVYELHNPGFDLDFSRRLTFEIERVCELGDLDPDELTGRITEQIYRGDLRELRACVSAYLQEKDAIWVLVDNLDKSWPTHGASDQDILVVRTLLEATRKLQRELSERDDVPLHCIVFLRTDIHEMLIRQTPDKGKDTAIRLDWQDRELFEQILARRIDASTDLGADFHDAWPLIFQSHIGVQDSFSYLLDRTLMRPRDILRFVARCVEVAINRGRTSVNHDDILKAERSYSEDLLLDAAFELQDTWPAFEQVVYSFHGAPTRMTRAELSERLRVAGVDDTAVEAAIEKLMWFGFLGVTGGAFAEDMYAHVLNYNVQRLIHGVDSAGADFVVHPAFRAALEVG